MMNTKAQNETMIQPYDNQDAKAKTFRIFLRILFSAACFAIFSLNSQSSQATNQLPAVSLNSITIACLENRNWECALEELVPQYYDQGPDSNLQYYIALCYRQLASTTVSNQHPGEAVAYLELARDFLDSDAELHAQTGALYLQLSKYDLAREAYTQALQLDENNPVYLENLGWIAYLNGQLTDAKEYWHKALEIRPDNPELQNRFQQLQKQGAAEHQGTTEMSHTFRLTFDNGMDRQIFNQVWKMLEDAWYTVGQQLDLYPIRQISVLLLHAKQFTAMTDAPAWAGGVYEGQIKISVADFDHIKIQEVITHEYVHALLYDTLANRCPWWLNEGLVQYFSLADISRNTRLNLAHKVLTENRITSLDQLPGNMQEPEQVEMTYALGLYATDVLIQRFSMITIRSILLSMGSGMNFAEALNKNTGYTFAEFEEMWREYR